MRHCDFCFHFRDFASRSGDFAAAFLAFGVAACVLRRLLAFELGADGLQEMHSKIDVCFSSSSPFPPAVRNVISVRIRRLLPLGRLHALFTVSHDCISCRSNGPNNVSNYQYERIRHGSVQDHELHPGSGESGTFSIRYQLPALELLIFENTLRLD